MTYKTMAELSDIAHKQLCAIKAQTSCYAELQAVITIMQSAQQTMTTMQVVHKDIAAALKSIK